VDMVAGAVLVVVWSGLREVGGSGWIGRKWRGEDSWTCPLLITMLFNLATEADQSLLDLGYGGVCGVAMEESGCDSGTAPFPGLRFGTSFGMPSSMDGWIR
jgi:hypothetical protein